MILIIFPQKVDKTFFMFYNRREKKGNIMNNKITEWMLEIGEITQLERCMLDILENSMNKGENNSYCLSFMQIICDKTKKLYEDMDEFTLGLKG